MKVLRLLDHIINQGHFAAVKADKVLSESASGNSEYVRNDEKQQCYTHALIETAFNQSGK